MRTVESLLFAILDYAGIKPTEALKLAKDNVLHSYILMYIERMDEYDVS